MGDHEHSVAERPFQPEIPRSRFALGMARYPSDLEELRLGRFSDGQQTRRSSSGGTAPRALQRGPRIARR